jgi:thymidine kinase
MAKLYFRHGTVGSAKTLNLLAVAHNYERQGKRVKVLKPAFDDRFGASRVASRAGLDRDADLLLKEDTRIEPAAFEGCHCVLVDEAQFLSARIVDQLRDLTRAASVPVICYGLRTDFRSRLFEGSRRLLEVADSIEEVKTTCAFCNRKAVFNLRSVDGVPTLSGPTRLLGAEELYLPVCYRHYTERLGLVDADALTAALEAEGDAER